MNQEQSNTEIKFFENKIEVLTKCLVGSLVFSLVGIVVIIVLALQLADSRSNHQKALREHIDYIQASEATIAQLNAEIKKEKGQRNEVENYSEIVEKTSQSYYGEIGLKTTEIIKLQSQLAQVQEQKRRLQERLKSCETENNK